MHYYFYIYCIWYILLFIYIIYVFIIYAYIIYSVLQNLIYMHLYKCIYQLQHLITKTKTFNY